LNQVSVQRRLHQRATAAERIVKETLQCMLASSLITPISSIPSSVRIHQHQFGQQGSHKLRQRWPLKYNHPAAICSRWVTQAGTLHLGVPGVQPQNTELKFSNLRSNKPHCSKPRTPPCSRQLNASLTCLYTRLTLKPLQCVTSRHLTTLP
jgi:hypothetical protein